MTDNVRDMTLNLIVNSQSNKIKEFNRNLKNTEKSINKVGWLSKTFGKIFGAYLGIQGIKNIVQTGAKLQLLRQSIVGLTKDVQDWEYIKQIAHQTGNSLDVVARGYKNFYAAANMAGFDKKSIQSMYSDMVMATRAIGASSEQTQGALLALEQMISKGTVSMEELRRQLGNAVPGAFEIGAKAMNMTTKELNDFIKKGELASAEFVPKFIAEFKRQYIGGFQEISQTLDFSVGQLKESWQELQLEIMNGEIGKELAHIVKSLDKLIRSNEFKQFIKMATKIISFAIDHLPLILAFLGIRGLLGAIQLNANAMALLSMGFKDAIHLIGLLAVDGVRGLGALEFATMSLYQRALLLLGAFMTLEDLITGIMHAFGLTERKSLTGEAWDAFLGKGDKGIGVDSPGGNLVMTSPKMLEKQKELYRKQGLMGLSYLSQGVKGFTPFSETPYGLPAMFKTPYWFSNLPELNIGRQMIGQALQFNKTVDQNFNFKVELIDKSTAPNQDKANAITNAFTNVLKGIGVRVNQEN